MYPPGGIGYESLEISDWLINYQGGFVRRGLAGELLWRLYQLHPYPVATVIMIIYFISVMLIITLLVWLFRRNGWSLYLLPFPLFLYVSLERGFMLGKRDYIQLLLAFVVFWEFRNYLIESALKKRIIHVVVLWCLTVLMLLLHEGIFFAVFPFLVLYTFVRYRESWKNFLRKTVLLWWPAGMILCMIVAFHGHEQTGQTIWHSWYPCFNAYPLSVALPALGEGLQWIGGSFAKGVYNSLDCSWRLNFLGPLPVWPFNVYMLACIYYLVTRMNTLRMGWYALKPIDHVQLSNIVLLQFVFILPLLGIIACDMCRFVPYWCVTSCFLYGLFPERKGIPSFIDRLSMRLQEGIDNSRLLCSPWAYFIVLITLPLCFSSASPNGMFPFIPNDLKHRLVEMLIG
jgi:hypothetical protein